MMHRDPRIRFFLVSVGVRTTLHIRNYVEASEISPAVSVDILEFLLRQHTKLSPDEWVYLAETPFLYSNQQVDAAAAGGSEPEPSLADKLFMPSEHITNLGLPVV